MISSDLTGKTLPAGGMECSDYEQGAVSPSYSQLLLPSLCLADPSVAAGRHFVPEVPAACQSTEPLVHFGGWWNPVSSIISWTFLRHISTWYLSVITSQQPSMFQSAIDGRRISVQHPCLESYLCGHSIRLWPAVWYRNSIAIHWFAQRLRACTFILVSAQLWICGVVFLTKAPCLNNTKSPTSPNPLHP